MNRSMECYDQRATKSSLFFPYTNTQMMRSFPVAKPQLSMPKYPAVAFCSVGCGTFHRNLLFMNLLYTCLYLINYAQANSIQWHYTQRRRMQVASAHFRLERCFVHWPFPMKRCDQHVQLSRSLLKRGRENGRSCRDTPKLY